MSIKYRKVNAKYYYRKEKGFVIPESFPHDPLSVEYYKKTKKFQETQKVLRPDGIYGPKTEKAVILTNTSKRETDFSGNGIIIGGTLIPTDFKVVNVAKEGALSFFETSGNWGIRRVKAPSKIVLHWDGLWTASQCYDTLMDRGYSSHFGVDTDGTVYQFLDPSGCRAYHAGNVVNDESIGIDVINPVRLSRNKYCYPERGIIEYEDPGPQIGRSFRRHLDFYDVQKRAATQLVSFLCGFFEIPKVLPWRGDNYLKVALQKKEVEQYKGVMGHYHISKSKSDPGLTLWPWLGSYGFKSEEL